MLSNWEKMLPTLLVQNAAALLDPMQQLASVSSYSSNQAKTIVDFSRKTATELRIDISGNFIPVAEMEITCV